MTLSLMRKEFFIKTSSRPFSTYHALIAEFVRSVRQWVFLPAACQQAAGDLLLHRARAPPAVDIFITANEECDDILCSNVYDPVCGVATTLTGRTFIKTYHNICHLRLIQCQFPAADLAQLPNGVCNIKNTYIDDEYNGRRLNDFSIVGAHQTCNHTCPTYCLDIYEPACAQIWTHNMQSYVYKPMINHCHIDLYSCVVGVNVTIQPLIGKCYKNPSALNFMFNVAAMKTLNLLDESNPLNINKKQTRRFNVNSIIQKEIKNFVEKLQKKIKRIQE